MANKAAPALPPLSPEHRRITATQFERANQVITSGNYDYAISLLLTCCKLDPANLIYRQKLRQTERAKYHNNMRGSSLAGLTGWPARMRLKAALRTGNYLKVLEAGERLLTRNPWDVPAQMAMSRAAEELGLLDLAVWFLEQARIKHAMDPVLNRALAYLYEHRGNFTQAMALWQLVRKARPGDEESQQKLKDLAVHDTIARGQYEAVAPGEADATDPTAAPVGAQARDDTAEDKPAVKPGHPAGPRGTPPPPSRQQGATPPPAGRRLGPEAASPAERLAREAGALKARLEADPTNVNTHLQLASLFRRADHLEEARAVLQKGLAPTSHAWELTIELADLEVEPFRRNLAMAEEKLKAKPDASDLLKVHAKLQKEVTSRELEIHRQKADRYPTELVHRYEVGVRLLRLGQIEEAIKELQAARSDPRLRWQALIHLGHCFKARNNWRLAQRNFEEALQALPAGEAERRKELLYDLARGCAAAGDMNRALELAQELANLDFGYRDIGRLLDEWEAAASK
jgi:tetratricopeptide (TPR) repeat protein